MRLLAVKTRSAETGLNRAVGLATAINSNQQHRLPLTYEILYKTGFKFLSTEDVRV